MPAERRGRGGLFRRGTSRACRHDKNLHGFAGAENAAHAPALPMDAGRSAGHWSQASTMMGWWSSLGTIFGESSPSSDSEAVEACNTSEQTPFSSD